LNSLLEWIDSVAKSNSKYADVVRITNLDYLQNFFIDKMVFYPDYRELAEEVKDIKEVALSRYTEWMVAYEFPSFASLTSRILSVSQRMQHDEMALYIHRHDVVKVVSGLDMRKLEIAVRDMYKRTEKHFGSEASNEGCIRRRMWSAISNNFCARWSTLFKSAKSSYQIALPCDETVVKKLCQDLIK